MRSHATRTGFTLIELLIVVVIIGILAAIAIPKFVNTKERSYLAAMKSDLRNLGTAQEAYLADMATYYGGAIPDPAFNYKPTTGGTVTMVLATAAGWQATATFAGTAKTCAMFYGTAPAIAPATVNGQPTCN